MDSPQVESTDWTIYTGPWVNWSDGIFIGATLTTSTNQGLILVSFLAIWVSLVGGSVWRIICFFLHQLRGRKNVVRDGLFHQEQAVLRNSDSAGATFILLVNMAWAWRGRASHAFWRVFPLALIAAIQVVVFIAAGILSSNIFSTDQQVLVRSDYCGYMTYPGLDSYGHFSQKESAEFNAATMESRTASQFALTYSRSCYGANPLPNCKNLFAVPSIALHTSEVACPFDAEICELQGNAAFRVDSGYINTNRDLGINSKTFEAIDYRRVTTCAPLKTEAYKEDVPIPKGYDETLTGGPYLGYSYGSPIGSSLSQTFIYDTYLGNSTSAYQPIVPAWAFTGPYTTGLNTFEPIKALNRTDGDVTVLMVANNVDFSAPTEDAWYKAKTSVSGSNLSKHVYTSSPLDPAIFMGCVEQHQICDPNKPRDTGCSLLAGWADLSARKDWDVNPAQKALIRAVLYVSQTGLIALNALNLGSSYLLASQYLQFGVTKGSTALPKNFWHREVESWHALGMAAMQKGAVNIGQGPANRDAQKFVHRPPKILRTDFDICSNIKIRDGRFYSFKIAGLLITIAGGLLMLILDLCLPWLTGKLQLLTHKGLHRKEDWELDHLLQIQRMANEGNKLGTWARNEGGVPVTLNAFGAQKFGKPGRGVGVYEEVEMDSKAWYGPEDDAEHLRPFHSRAASRSTSYWQPQPTELSGAPSFVSSEYAGYRQQQDMYWAGSHSSGKKWPATSVREFT